MGRAKGGLILALKKGIYKRVVERREGGNEILVIEGEKNDKAEMVVVVYMRENRKGNLEFMHESIEENRGSSIIIGGDFNARTGGEGE